MDAWSLMCNHNKTLVTEEKCIKKHQLSNWINSDSWTLPGMRFMSLSANQKPEMWPIRTNQRPPGECDQCMMLLSGLRTLLVVLGLQDNGQDRESEGHQHQHHEGPALPDQGLQYGGLASPPRGAFECSKKYSSKWWKQETSIDVFRSWQKDEIQIGVKRRTEWEEIYMSCRRHNLILQVLQGTNTNISHKLLSVPPLYKISMDRYLNAKIKLVLHFTGQTKFHR